MTGNRQTVLLGEWMLFEWEQSKCCFVMKLLPHAPCHPCLPFASHGDVQGRVRQRQA